MAKDNNTILIVIGIIAVIAIFFLVPKAQPNDLQSILKTTHTITTQGDIITSSPALFSFVDDKEGYIDDNRVVGCKTSTGSVVRYFGDVGWSEYDSCQGWMAYWGCDTWDEQNGGDCSGSSSDSDDIGCSFDSDCSSGQYCTSSGQCSDAECSSGYECSKGTIYHCIDGKWKYYGSCYDQTYEVNCAKSKSTTPGDLCLKAELQEELFSCTGWGECVDGVQTRTCKWTGEGTPSVAPDEEKSCNILDSIADKLGVSKTILIIIGAVILIAALFIFIGNKK